LASTSPNRDGDVKDLFTKGLPDAGSNFYPRRSFLWAIYFGFQGA
jgi:hypothetical protein